MGELFKNLMMGFQTVGNVQSIIWILVGVCVGILGGAIPGISLISPPPHHDIYSIEAGNTFCYRHRF